MNKLSGLFDIHVHGIAGSDADSGDIEEIIRIARVQKSSGTDKLILSIRADTIQNMRHRMEAIGNAAKKIETENAEDCAGIAGVHLEGPFLNPVRAGALRKEVFIPPSLYALHTLIEGYEDLVKMITIAPELKDSEKVIRSCSDSGIMVSIGHSDATYLEAEAGWKAGARGITHLFNAMRPFHHREPGIAGLGLLNGDIYIEVIADGVHLDLNTLKLIFRLKPAEKIILVSDSVKGERAPDTAVYNEGLLAGSGVTLADEIRFLLKNGFDPDTVYMMASLNPYRFIYV